ncbi:cryptochrome circadian regulator 3a [Pundamilia nyererei]|uniref:Cryptochrome circadian regulator 3a n=1 Tax=Pundamilia nyererei TaxID=303518 RepID=A0A9Y3VYS2_9CICH|nr:PREDICTED: cryptochrome-1-like [Pundamilia nyererei]XP_026010740.1 cryptochrome-1-like [Astatotilapia calliptera]
MSPPGSQHKNKMALNSIHWFRKGLRLHDNPALREAVQGASTVRCVYFLDPWFAGSSNVGVNRWRFLLQCLEDLDASLRKLNSRLFVIRGQPANVFPRLFKEWKISRLTFEYDSEPFGKERDAAIKKLAMEAGVEVIVKISHTLYDLDKIIELNGGQPPLTYKRFQTLISRLDPPEMPVEMLTDTLMGHCVTPVLEDHGDKYGVPSLEELGFDTEGLPSAVWPGGETEALTRIERHLERKAWVANFERPRMNANSLLASPTGLSPYLRFGCLSCRLFYFKLTDLYRKVKKNSSPPLSLYGQLLWREFFYTAATNNPRFDKMEGNPICVRIPWDKNPEALAKWAEAKTGFPWIDAIMTQLRQEGWIHHLARHAVACFLTRGDLWISWEEGMKVFEELLLDADWSVNAGSWMWLSCSSFFQQFFHCYCPVGFGRRTDPNGDFIRRYLPVLRGFPAKFIYDPWNAPESVQAAAKCIIGVHYPKPMVHHAEASRLNIERMKQIYQQLSRYRGLGLLASVPSTHGNGNGGMMAFSPGEQHPGTNSSHTPGVSGSPVPTGNGSGSILLNFDSEEQTGPSGVGQQHQRLQQHGYHSVPDTSQNTSSRLYHEFAVPQHPGLLLHPRGGITGKRERESEREGSGEEEPASCSVHKMQRQSAEAT